MQRRLWHKVGHPGAHAPPRTTGTVCPHIVPQGILNYEHMIVEIDRTIAEPVSLGVIFPERKKKKTTNKLPERTSISSLMESPSRVPLPPCHILSRIIEEAPFSHGRCKGKRTVSILMGVVYTLYGCIIIFKLGIIKGKKGGGGGYGLQNQLKESHWFKENRSLHMQRWGAFAMKRKERMDTELLLLQLGMNGGREPEGCTGSYQQNLPAIPAGPGTDLAVTLPSVATGVKEGNRIVFLFHHFCLLPFTQIQSWFYRASSLKKIRL